MMDNNVIDLVKVVDYILDVANKRGISQRKLAEGVCDPGNFNKVCNGKRKPQLSHLLVICMKLGITTKELWENCSEAINSKDARRVMDTLDFLNDTQEYEVLKELLDFIETDETLKQGIGKQYLLWYRAIVENKINHEYQKSIDLCFDAIQITNPNFKPNKVNIDSLNERELKIFNGIIVNYHDLNNLDKAMSYYEEAIITINNLKTVEDTGLLPKLCYNYAVLKSEKEDFESALNYIKLGIEYSVLKNDYVVIARLHYIGYISSMGLREYMDAEQHILKCKAGFLLQNFSQEYLENIDSLAKKIQLKHEEELCK